jgi:hypothetical protein
VNAPKILRYDWADLTGQEELEPQEVESLRLVIKVIESNLFDHKGLIQALLQDHTTYLLSKPTSDFGVIVYRLLDQDGIDKSVRFQAIHGGDKDTELSIQELVNLISGSFALSKRPMPIISGIPPRIYL